MFVCVCDGIILIYGTFYLLLSSWTWELRINNRARDIKKLHKKIGVKDNEGSPRVNE